MATRLISKQFKVEGDLKDVTSAKLSDSTGTYGIKRNDLSASTITGGTLANPVVITTSAAHGLSDGQMVNFLSMVGMTDLEGLNYYAKVTGQSATSYALYQETGLTNTVDGTAFAGAATGGTATPAEVADGTDMTNSATGVYQYSFDDTANIAYTAQLEFVYNGATYRIEEDIAARTAGGISLVYSMLRTEIADYLGWSRDSGNWSSDEEDRLVAVLNGGYRQFIYPPVAPGETVAYRWSFVRPSGTFDTVGSTYLYDLPSDYAAIVGDLSFDEDEDESRIIEHTTPGMIDRCRASDDYEGRPYLFAIRPKSASQTIDQVLEFMLYPTPDAAYGIVYHYDAKVVELSAANQYPLGGQSHSETILQSCRDIAATRYKDDPGGREHQLFLERLKASIETDRKQSPKTLGLNSDGQNITHTRHGSEFAIRMSHNISGGPWNAVP